MDIIISELIVLLVLLLESSINGGLIVIVMGNGFDLLLGKISVIIGNVFCEIVFVIYGEIMCRMLLYVVDNLVIL